MGTFSRAQTDLRKARERELATLDEKLTSSGIAENLCAIKIEGKSRGGEGTTPVTTAQKLGSRYVQKKKKKISVTGSNNTAKAKRNEENGSYNSSRKRNIKIEDQKT